MNGRDGFIERPHKCNLVAANATSMKVQTAVSCDINVAGLAVPADLIIIADLTHPIILGIDWLETAQASVNLHDGTLQLYGGQITVPLVQTDDGITVVTTAAVQIPARSQAHFPVQARSKVKPGIYKLQPHPRLSCKTLLVAHAVVEQKYNNKSMPCCVVNPSDKPIFLRKGTPVGLIATTNVLPIKQQQNDYGKAEEKLTIEQMKADLEKKKISLAKTTATGQDLENLIKTLHANLDLFAIDYSGLVGCKFDEFRVDTQGAAPLKAKPYRRSPEQNLQIDNEIKRLESSNIIERSTSPWASNLVLINSQGNQQDSVLI